MGSYWAGTHGPFHLCPSTWPSVLAPRAPGAALLHFPGGKQKCISQNALRSQMLLKKKFSQVTHMQSSLLSFLSSECELRTSKCSCALRLVALSWPFAVPLQSTIRKMRRGSNGGLQGNCKRSLIHHCGLFLCFEVQKISTFSYDFVI